MKTFATKEKQSAPAGRKARPYVHYPMEPVQRAMIQRILHSTSVQAKFTIGQSNNKYEQAADRIADRVMAMPYPKLQCQSENEELKKTLPTKPLADQITPLVQRQEESLNNSCKGGGQPLDSYTRSFFEPRFGCNFNNVRVHADSNASEAAGSVQARAFTLGSDVVFASGEYQPQSDKGRRLIAHELTHVLQQSYPGRPGIMRKAYVWPGEEKKYVYKTKSKPKPKSGCLYPTYPGMLGITYRGVMWYPHDFFGPLKSGMVRASKSILGYAVPHSPSGLYNCMRWAVGHGVPSSKERWYGVKRSSSVPWPEEKFLKDKGCSNINASAKSSHKVKLYEYKHQDQFHIVRQEPDGTWSSKTGDGYLYRGIIKPDSHTAYHYVPMNKMKSTYWTCP